MNSSTLPPPDSQTSDIESLLKGRMVLTHYQPLVSIKKRALLGFEALSRGCAPSGDVTLAPGVLFSLPRTSRQRIELDRLCRDKALQGFRSMYATHKELLLSINMDVSLLDTEAAGSTYLAIQAREAGIHPNNVLIEIIESNVLNTKALLDFINRYREQGFLIALDDVGAGHSNMERIALIKPDVIKIDRSLINCIHEEIYKYEVARSLVGLGQRIGAMVLAEGVERQEEAITLLELGVDVFQGYFFARPAPLTGTYDRTLEAVHGVAATFREHVLKSISAKKRRYGEYDALLQELIRQLVRVGEGYYDRVLAEYMSSHEDLECTYVLADSGIQLTDTICNPMRISENRRFIYQPAQKGADHSLKDYFLPINAGLPKYTTESYISMASGNVCTTIAAAFSNNDSARRIICMDIAHKG